MIAGLRLIITIQMAHLTPHCLMYSPTTPTLYDVGGNTGKWALRCKFNENIAVTLLDLPPGKSYWRKKIYIANAGFSDRIDFHAVDMLSDAPLPGEADLVDEPIFRLFFHPNK